LEGSVTLIGGLRSGLGGVRTTGGPTDGGGPPTPTPPAVFPGAALDMILSYGHGVPDVDDQIPSTEGGFEMWLSPTDTADISEPGQVREWVTLADLTNVAIVVRIDLANMTSVGGPWVTKLVVTVDGSDVAAEVVIPSGITTNTTLIANVALAIAANSKVGCAFSTSGELDAASRLRCEVRLIASGAVIPTPPILPPVLPGFGLLFDWETDPAVSTITLTGGAISKITDASGNAFDLVQATALRRPTLAAAAFNAFDGIVFPAAMDRILEYATSNMGLADGGARTVMCVCKPDGAAGGSLVVFKRATDYLGCELWLDGGTQRLYGNGAFPTPANIDATTPVDYGGNRIVVIWDFDGTDMFVSVQGIDIPASGTTIGDETSVAPGVTLGNNNGVFGDRGFIGKIAMAAGWSRSLRATPGDTNRALAYAVKYL
jgi:hypothetical protein